LLNEFGRQILKMSEKMKLSKGLGIFALPLSVLTGSLCFERFFPSFTNTYEYLNPVLDSLIWFAAASILNRSIYLFFWKPLRDVREVAVPKLLTNLQIFVVWLITSILVLDIVFKQPIAGIVTTSTVIVGVSGLAMRDYIADFISGILIGIERNIRIGDWINVDGKFVGEVVGMGSRSIELLDNDRMTVFLPNQMLTRLPVRNYSYPDDFWRDRLTITFGYEVTYHQVQRILFSAIQSIPELAKVPLRPEVSVDAYTDRGILWSLKFWVPNYGERSRLSGRLHQKILRNMHYSGINFPYPKQIVEQGDIVIDGEREEDLAPILRKVSLFESLSEEELREVAEDATRTTHVAGSQIIRQGDVDYSSLFVLHEGLLGVQLDGIEVAQLPAGSFFGEMSLLTGAPRSVSILVKVDASIVEVPKDVIERLLQRRPEIAAILGEVLAKRQLANREAAEKSAIDKKSSEKEKQTLANQIASRIRNFFGIG